MQSWKFKKNLAGARSQNFVDHFYFPTCIIQIFLIQLQQYTFIGSEYKSYFDCPVRPLKSTILAFSPKNFMTLKVKKHHSCWMFFEKKSQPSFYRRQKDQLGIRNSLTFVRESDESTRTENAVKI